MSPQQAVSSSVAAERRFRRIFVAVVSLVVLVGAVWVVGQVERAGRYAHEIEATGVAPYAPDGWAADGVGTWSDGVLRYSMHDASGSHVEVTVRRASGSEQGLVPYQQHLVDRYGVLVSLASQDTGARTASLTTPGQVGSELQPRSARWLADRACRACRLVSHVVGGGVLFG